MQENKILVVGNGYDVACGLQSRFTDFFNPMLSRYLYHIKNISNAKNKINTIENFYNLLDENFISKFFHQIPLNEDEENFFKTDFSLYTQPAAKKKSGIWNEYSQLKTVRLE